MAGTPSWRLAVLLTPFQDRIAGIVSELPEARGFALAGAGGLVVRGLIDRPTRDLDYFTVPGEERALVELRDALERAFESAGLACTRRRDLATFVRLEVGDGDERCEIDLAIDYRAMPCHPSRATTDRRWLWRNSLPTRSLRSSIGPRPATSSISWN